MAPKILIKLCGFTVYLLWNHVFSSFLISKWKWGDDTSCRKMRPSSPVRVLEVAIGLTVTCLGRTYPWLSLEQKQWAIYLSMAYCTKHVHCEGVSYEFHGPYPDIIVVHITWLVESGFATKHQWFDETFSFHSQLYVVAERINCKWYVWNFKRFRKFILRVC